MVLKKDLLKINRKDKNKGKIDHLCQDKSYKLEGIVFRNLSFRCKMVQVKRPIENLSVLLTASALLTTVEYAAERGACEMWSFAPQILLCNDEK